MTLVRDLRSQLTSLFEIDLRSLACFRIGVALVVLVDLGLRVCDLDALYGARGVLPPEVARTLWDRRVALSPFTWVAAWPWLLWTGAVLLAIAAICLALGVAPRLAAFVTWALLAGLQDRNPALYMGGDRYLLLLLMWCILLPTGARFSLHPAPLGVTRIRSWAATGLLLQVMLAYVFTGLKKIGPEWFDGTALWFALNQPDIVSPAGRWLVSKSALTVLLSYTVKWGEIFAPLFVLSPWYNSAARLLAVAFFWAFHLGLEVTMQIGVFQMVGLAAWLVFLPSAVWQWHAKRDSAGEPGPMDTVATAQPARWSEIIALVPLGYVTLQLICTVAGITFTGLPYPVPRLVDKVAIPLHIQEGWAMYMRVPRVQRWVVVPGRLADGSMIDALRDSPLQWTRPANFQAAQRGFRWTHYLNNAIMKAVFDPVWGATHQPLLQYLCRDWNQNHEPKHRLEHVELNIVVEAIPDPGSRWESPRVDRALATYDCPRSFDAP